jgi:large subunit ribosomal protein L19
MGETTMGSQVVDKVNARKTEVAFSVGDSVKVHVKIKEGDKERIQMFSGTVIGRQGRGATETFIVRRVSHGVGVERVFPVHSPYLAKIEVESTSSVRRAKLYFLRTRTGKQSRLRAGAEKKEAEA